MNFNTIRLLTLHPPPNFLAGILCSKKSDSTSDLSTFKNAAHSSSVMISFVGSTTASLVVCGCGGGVGCVGGMIVVAPQLDG